MCLGVPARIVALGADGRATADVGGVRREVSLALTPEAEAEDWVLLHVGFALAVIDEDHARETLALLEEMELLE